MSRVKIGFIGCGTMAAIHRDRLIYRDDVELVGCHDTVTKHAEAFAGKWNIPVFEDVISLYEKARPHAVFIAVPPFAHGDIELEAAARGIHFFVETPVALDIKTARTISAAVRKSKILAMAGYCYRYYDLTLTARHLLRGDVISLVTGQYYCGMPETSWLRRRKESGGQIVEQTTHVIDLLLHLCGPVSEVHALGARGCMSRTNNFDLDESSVINLRLKTGAVASISSTCILSHPGGMALEITTPRFSLSLTHEHLRIREDHKITDYLNQTDMYQKETELFIHAVEQGKRSGIRTTYSEAIKTLRVTLAANESIQTGLPVIL